MFDELRIGSGVVRMVCEKERGREVEWEVKEGENEWKFEESSSTYQVGCKGQSGRWRLKKKKRRKTMAVLPNRRWRCDGEMGEIGVALSSAFWLCCTIIHSL